MWTQRGFKQGPTKPQFNVRRADPRTVRDRRLSWAPHYLQSQEPGLQHQGVLYAERLTGGSSGLPISLTRLV
jgi:hypothetical protein